MTNDITVFLDASHSIEAGFQALDVKHKIFTDLSQDELITLLGTIDGEKEVKAAKKELVTIRTNVGKLHKAAKAPLLEATREIDGVKKELEAQVKQREKFFDDAINAKKNQKEAEEKAALAARVAELESALEQNGIEEPEFIPQSLELSIKGRAQLKALESLLGKDILQALRFDKEGNGYSLSVTVSRKEIVL